MGLVAFLSMPPPTEVYKNAWKISFGYNLKLNHVHIYYSNQGSSIHLGSGPK